MVRAAQVGESAWALDTVRPGVRLLGGFAGTENASWERPAAGPATVLAAPGGAWVLRASGVSVVLDDLTLRNAATGLLAQPAGNLVGLVDVRVEQITGYGVDVVGQGTSAPRLDVQDSVIDASLGQGGIRAASEAGTLGGLVRRNTIVGGSQAGIRLQARPVTGEAVVSPDIVANTIVCGASGIVLGAEVTTVSFDGVNSSFVGSNLIYGTTGDAVSVEATGSSIPAGTAARAVPLIVGNTLSHAGGAGIRSSVSRSGALSGEVRSQPQLWDNLVTFHAGPAIEESADDPGAGLAADPLVVGNDLFGSGALYRDEGAADLTIEQVNALPGAYDNYDADPGYVDPGLGDYHIRSATIVGLGSPMLYLDNTSDPGIAMSWTAEGFVPAGWSGGLFGVGYDVGPLPNGSDLLQTVVPAGTVSVFTRMSFTIDDVGDVTALTFGADYDDGVVAWINSQELFRSASMPAGPLDWQTPAASHESSNAPAPVYEQTAVSAVGIPALHDGENVLAVGVWNTNAASADLVLVPQLIVNQELPPVDAGHLEAPRLAAEDIDGDARVIDGTLSGIGGPDTGADERLCSAADAACTLDCIDGDGDGFCLGQDCDDTNAACAVFCTDVDGDGFCVTSDCDDANPNCNSDCTDADADGFCVTSDCDEANPNCNSDCTDADADGFCVTSDCDDANPNCTTSCIDVDTDGFCVTSDCDDANPNCTITCSDPDGDGVCPPHDCWDVNPFCSTDCTDADGDLHCVTDDCDDSNPNCTTDCTDADGDGFCVIHDCDEANPNCTADCTDADADGFCVIHDCDEANPNCTADCTDADADGFCVIHDCDDGNPNCNSDCLDADADGFCVTHDCDDNDGGVGPCNCCSGGNGIGCDCQVCEDLVCAVFSFCCNSNWTTSCDSKAAELCSCCPPGA